MVKIFFFRLRRAPSSGISLSGGQVSDGRLRRGLIVVAEHAMTCFTLTSRPSGLERTQHWVRDDKKSRLFGFKEKFRLRRAPSSGISLSGGQVSDGRLRRGSIVTVEHPHDMCFVFTSRLSGLERTQFWVRDNKKVMYFGTCCLMPPKR